MFLGLFTGLCEVGGIQRISQHTAAVLEGIARDRGQRCELFSLNDPVGTKSFVLGGQEYEFRAFGRNKSRFVASVFSLARQAGLVYLGHPNLAPLGFFSRLLNPKLRYWVATYGLEVWSPLPLLRRLSLRDAQGITALSRFTAEQMIQAQELDPRKVTLLPPALDPGFAEIGTNGATISLLARDRVILTVGRLLASEPGKGVDTIIHALPKVLTKTPNARLVVVGEGDYRHYLQRLARELGVSGQVLFTGEKLGDDLKAYYQRADIFAMPSRQEGFGVVFLEAMAFGKPIIACKQGGIPEVVRDGVNGFLVEYGDVETLADRLVHLLEDEGLRAHMGMAGRCIVEENYTFERFRFRLAQLLDEHK